MTAITISLQKLTCHQAPRRRRRKPPYLWTVFFKIDGSTVRLSPQFELQGEAEFHFTPGSHCNLIEVPLAPGQTTEVTPALGTWQTELLPIEVPFFDYQMPGLLGVAAVLMQENNVSDIGAEAGHQALNEYVRVAVNRSIQQFSVKQIDVENIRPSLKRYFAQQVHTLADGIESQVKRAVADAQTLAQNLWSLVDQDELIGYRVWDFMASELSEPLVPLQQRWVEQSLGTWELRGEITQAAS